MIFDALLFNGENPFDAGEDTDVVRLNDLTEEEARILNDIVSRQEGVGVFFYISDAG